MGITIKQRSQIIRAVNKLVNAAISDAWKGAGHPDDVPATEAELRAARAQFKSLLAGLVQVACPNAAHMGEYACANRAQCWEPCANRAQCWEPCGALGKSAAHTRAAPGTDGVGVVQTPGMPAKLPAITAALGMCMAASSEAKLSVPMCWDLALYVKRLEDAVALGVSAPVHQDKPTGDPA